ncbi:MAG: putative ABC exporter domain-containing protein [Vicinamibacterales bacterium]
MAGATLYIIGCSARNRFRIRLRRLREPRYLIGAIAGLAYLAFTLVIRDRAYAGQTGNGNVSFMAVEPTIGAVLLAVAALASWAMPFKSALLEFSKAEIAFLFPAPLTRARLVRYRIQRSQTAVFAAALIMALAYPIGTWPARTRWLAGAWVVLMAARIFFAIVTLARIDRTWRGRPARLRMARRPPAARGRCQCRGAGVVGDVAGDGAVHIRRGRAPAR